MSIVQHPDVAQIDEARILARALQPYLEHPPPPERADEFGQFFDRFGDAELVCLDKRRTALPNSIALVPQSLAG